MSGDVIQHINGCGCKANNFNTVKDAGSLFTCRYTTTCPKSVASSRIRKALQMTLCDGPPCKQWVVAKCVESCGCRVGHCGPHHGAKSGNDHLLLQGAHLGRRRVVSGRLESRGTSAEISSQINRFKTTAETTRFQSRKRS